MFEYISEFRKGLYYGEYEYKLGIPPEVHKGVVGKRKVHANHKEYTRLVALRDYMYSNHRKKNLRFNVDRGYYKPKNTLFVYTSDHDIIEKLIVDCPNLAITKAIVSDVLYFAREPKHKFRVFMADKRVSLNEFIEFSEYLMSMREKGILFPSRALIDRIEWWGKRTDLLSISGFRMPSDIWLVETNFIDFSDENAHMMLRLKYDDFFGNYYRLEKKTPENQAASRTSQVSTTEDDDEEG